MRLGSWAAPDVALDGSWVWFQAAGAARSGHARASAARRGVAGAAWQAPTPRPPLMRSGGQGSLADIEDARARLSALTPDFEDGVSYLVGCSYEAASDTLGLMGGSLEGGLGIYPVMDTDPAGPLKQPLSLLAGGHADIVRCALPLGEGRVVTGGEDARVCLWDLTQGVRSPGPAGPAALPAVGRGAKHLPQHTRRTSPY